MTSVHVHIVLRYFIKPLTSISDFSELANKQTNKRIYELINIYTHIVEMNILIDNTL
jgi:hypothetical protein